MEFSIRLHRFEIDCEVNDMGIGNNHGAFLYQLFEEYRKQWAENIAPSLRDKRSDSTTPPAASEKLQMTETRIYVGLNDSQTKEQKHETEKYMSVLKNVSSLAINRSTIIREAEWIVPQRMRQSSIRVHISKINTSTKSKRHLGSCLTR